MVEKFAIEFQSMEIPIKLEHLKLCLRESREKFETYVNRLRTLANQIKEMPELKELVKIR